MTVNQRFREAEAYDQFMHNLNNKMNCGHCPENEKYAPGFPCGKEKCLVISHFFPSRKIHIV
jgi:hypothetical protein